MEDQRFSITGRLRSIRYAAKGIYRVFSQEHNAWVHLGATIFVTGAGWAFKVSIAEAIALTIVIALVWITEILNTCIEKMADMITRERHPQIGLIKDMAAGAVLVAAIAAVIVGLFIFIPKIF